MVLYLCEYHGWFPPQRRWHLLFRGLADPSLHLWSHDAPAHKKHDPCNNVKNPAWSLPHQHLLHILIHCIFHDVMIWCIMYDVQFKRTFKCVVISSFYYQYLKKLYPNMRPHPLKSTFLDWTHHNKLTSLSNFKVISKWDWMCSLILPKFGGHNFCSPQYPIIHTQVILIYSQSLYVVNNYW